MTHAPGSTRPQKILVVEDEEDMRNVLAEELTQAGYDVTQAKNGKEGLLAALTKHPDLIVLDIVMPVMDGMAMMKKVRQDAWGKTVPIILLTNLSVTEKILENMVREEPSYYLVKSDWAIKDIIAKVKERLNAHTL